MKSDNGDQMIPAGQEATPTEQETAQALSALAVPPPGDFALRVLHRVGVPDDRYDRYVRLSTPAGDLRVAYRPEAVTGAALAPEAPGPSSREPDGGGSGEEAAASAFEEAYRARTGRSTIPTTKPFPGLVSAVRDGRSRRLPLDLDTLTDLERALLTVVRAVPAGQLRPLSWVAAQAELSGAPDGPVVIAALGRSPMDVLIPSHRITYEDGAPWLDTPQGDALREAEGIDMARMTALLGRGAMFLGSDTTRIYCHPTCASARRITPAHQVPFRTAQDARRAGYRACKVCRPVPA